MNTYLKIIAHQRIAFFILPFLMAILILGTIAQRFVGLYEAQKQYFFSYIVWLGPVPVPGTLTLLSLLLFSLLCKFIFFSPWKMKRLGINLAHLGVLVLLFGGLITLVDKQEGDLVLFAKQTSATIVDSNTKKEYTLPFQVTLKQFTKRMHPGTDKAKSYSSDVVVKDGAVAWPAHIAMNEPLRYKGYTLFQSSYIVTSDNREATVLAVVKNRGWLFPYLGTIIISLGLLLHFLWNRKHR